MIVSDCPFCGTDIKLSQKPHLQQKIICSVCQGVSVVSSLSPVELDEAYWQGDRYEANKKQKQRRVSEKYNLAYLEDFDWDQEEKINRGRGKSKPFI